MIVSDGQHAQVVLSDEVGDVIRKARHRRAANVEIRRNTGNQRSGTWLVGELTDGRIDGIDERRAETWTLVVVPCGRRIQFSGGLRRESNRHAHRSSLLRSRSRSLGHASPASSPESARRARCSSSSAHATDTAAGSVMTGSSRLARSSAATSARSRDGRVSASRSTASASIDIRSSVPTGGNRHGLDRLAPQERRGCPGCRRSAESRRPEQRADCP